MNAPSGVQIDHRDNDGLNCRKYNLRSATPSQNQQNRKANKNPTGFKGVDFHPWLLRKRYSARIKLNGHRVFLGYHLTAEEAARAYDTKARELFGEFACLNFGGPNERSIR